jgi:hypothetical protein
MRRLGLFLMASTILAVSPAQAQNWYAFSSVCSTCGTATSANQFYDDGAHDDGAAGDGVFGAIVTVDRPAGRYDWYADVGPPNTGLGGGIPRCRCIAFSFTNQAKLWTTGPGDVIHFRYSFNPPSQGWGGQYLSAGPHGIPPGAELEIMLSADPKWFPPGPSVPAHRNGAYWEGVMTIASPGTYPFMFLTVDQTVVYSDSYNCWCGCFPGEQPSVKFTTTQPNSDVRFQFDPVSGLMRGLELGPTPTRTPTWGAIKTLYR